MATNLYETLGINRNATPEEIRKAYRRKALETHPDRLPQGVSAAEKSASEELFRKVNNAYEVLQDPKTRATYDQHGVWPPPEPTPQRPFQNGPSSSDPSSDPFFREPFHDSFSRAHRMDPFGGFGFGPRPAPRPFTDPFVLFNSIFGDFHRAFEADPFFDDPFGRRGFGAPHPGGNHFLGGGPFLSMMPPMSMLDMGGASGSSTRTQTFGNGGNGGRWVSQSWSSSTVNGVTHTKSVRRDSEGNEHVTYRYPDGTERHTINGVEQSNSQPLRALPPSVPPAPPVSNRTHDTVPPPPYHEAVVQPHHRAHSHSYTSRHHGDHYDRPDDRRGDRDDYRHGHERDRGREHEYERGGRGHRDDRYAQDARKGSSWNFWKH